MGQGRTKKYNDGRVPPFRRPITEIVSSDPSIATTITAAGGITITNRLMRITGGSAPVTITATPNISAKFTVDGYELLLEGQDDTNTVELQDAAQLAGSGLHLQDTLNKVLGKGDFLRLIYNATDACWYQSSPMSNN